MILIIAVLTIPIPKRENRAPTTERGILTKLFSFFRYLFYGDTRRKNGGVKLRNFKIPSAERDESLIMNEKNK